MKALLDGAGMENQRRGLFVFGAVGIAVLALMPVYFGYVLYHDGDEMTNNQLGVPESQRSSLSKWGGGNIVVSTAADKAYTVPVSDGAAV